MPRTLPDRHQGNASGNILGVCQASSQLLMYLDGHHCVLTGRVSAAEPMWMPSTEPVVPFRYEMVIMES